MEVSVPSPASELDASIQLMRSMDRVPELACVRGPLSDIRDHVLEGAAFAKKGQRDSAMTSVRFAMKIIGVTFGDFEGVARRGETDRDVHQRLAAFNQWMSTFHRIISAIHLVLDYNLSRPTAA